MCRNRSLIPQRLSRVSRNKKQNKKSAAHRKVQKYRVWKEEKFCREENNFIRDNEYVEILTLWRFEWYRFDVLTGWDLRHIISCKVLFRDTK